MDMNKALLKQLLMVHAHVYNLKVATEAFVEVARCCDSVNGKDFGDVLSIRNHIQYANDKLDEAIGVLQCITDRDEQDE